MGFMRLKPDIQIELIPLLFQSLPNRSIPHQELLMGLIVYGLQNVKIIPNMNDNVVKYGLSDQPTIRQLFLNFLLNVILIPYKYVMNSFFYNRMTRIQINNTVFLTDLMKAKFELQHDLFNNALMLNLLKHQSRKHFFQQWMTHRVKKLRYSNNHIHA